MRLLKIHVCRCVKRFERSVTVENVFSYLAKRKAENVLAVATTLILLLITIKTHTNNGKNAIISALKNLYTNNEMIQIVV